MVVHSLIRVVLVAGLALALGGPFAAPVHAEPLPGEESEYLLGGRPVEDVLVLEHWSTRARLADIIAARAKFLTAASCLVEAEGGERIHWEIIDGEFDAGVCMFRLFALMDGTERLEAILANSGLVLRYASTHSFETISGRPAIRIPGVIYRIESYELPFEMFWHMPFRNVAGYWNSFLTHSISLDINRNETGQVITGLVTIQSIWR